MFESDVVLPERALAGDPPARRILVDRIHRPLARASHAPLLQTATAYLETGGSLEASARALFVHPNTVRYRLRTHLRRDGLRPHVTARGLDRAHRPGPGRLAATPAPSTASTPTAVGSAASLLLEETSKVSSATS